MCPINFGYGIIFGLRGVFLEFLSKFLCVAVPKNFVGETFFAVFHKISAKGKLCG